MAAFSYTRGQATGSLTGTAPSPSVAPLLAPQPSAPRQTFNLPTAALRLQGVPLVSTKAPVPTAPTSTIKAAALQRTGTQVAALASRTFAAAPPVGSGRPLGSLGFLSAPSGAAPRPMPSLSPVANRSQATPAPSQGNTAFRGLVSTSLFKSPSTPVPAAPLPSTVDVAPPQSATRMIRTSDAGRMSGWLPEPISRGGIAGQVATGYPGIASPGGDAGGGFEISPVMLVAAVAVVFLLLHGGA